MATGTVKFFNVVKGFGFIAPDQGLGDLFFHVTAVKGGGRPEVGVRVEFDESEGRKGPAAVNVRVI